MVQPLRMRAVIVILTLLSTAACSGPSEHANPIERGAYLVTIGGCHDCHTPKVFTAGRIELDESRLLSGHPAFDVLPGVPASAALGPNQWGVVANAHLTAWVGPWGVSYAPNLTPDKTGIAEWTEEQFLQAMRNGKHAGDGETATPPMPRFNYARMSKADLRAIFAYLRSLPAVANAVPASVPPVMATAAPTGG
jgi:hypothetical protein